MKTLTLEIDDSAYTHVLNFLRSVPQCRVIDTDILAESGQPEPAEWALQPGDAGEFKDRDVEHSFRQSWQEARRGEIYPLQDLWQDVG